MTVVMTLLIRLFVRQSTLQLFLRDCCCFTSAIPSNETPEVQCLSECVGGVTINIYLHQIIMKHSFTFEINLWREKG